MLETFDANGWSWSSARHLLNRAGFGGSVADVDAIYALGFEKAVDRLTDPGIDGWEMEKPEWAVYEDPRPRMREMKDTDAATRQKKFQQFQKAQRLNMVDLSWRWLDWMGRSPQPLREKLALFLHGHFATSADKVRNSYLLWQQNDLLRREGLGSFVALTKAVSRDPAMLIYLDGQSNSRKKPNENFAREVMELFTLGEGHYTEGDVTEAARAFTGYRIDQETGTSTFVPAGHDNSPKSVFGKNGDFSGDDVIDLIFSKPEAGRFLARKIWEFFVYASPDERLIAGLGEDFRRSSYDTRSLLRHIFRSAEFYSERAIGKIVKSPVQWIVQTGRELECGLPRAAICQKALGELGQTLFRPPNVKGWDGGRAWINASTLLYRYNLAAAYCGARGVLGKRAMPEIDFSTLVGDAIRGDTSAVVDTMARRLYGSEATGKERQSFVTFWISERDKKPIPAVLGELTRLMMSTPRYQLC